jgi:hypothetical protein
MALAQNDYQPKAGEARGVRRSVKVETACLLSFVYEIYQIMMAVLMELFVEEVRRRIVSTPKWLRW